MASLAAGLANSLRDERERPLQTFPSPALSAAFPVSQGRDRALCSIDLHFFLAFVYTSYILHLGDDAHVRIQKWGNSQGLRIPKVLLDALGLRENDRVELIQADNGIHIKKAAAGHRTLEEQLAAFYGKPVGEIIRLETQEIDWGQMSGDEVWRPFLSRGTSLYIRSGSLSPDRRLSTRARAAAREAVLCFRFYGETLTSCRRLMASS